MQTQPEETSNIDLAMVSSDASDNVCAIRDIDKWARDNGFVRSNEYHLGRRQKADGKMLFFRVLNWGAEPLAFRTGRKRPGTPAAQSYGANDQFRPFPIYNNAMRKWTTLKTTQQPTTPDVLDGYWTSAHTTYRLRFHLVWVPKYRRRVLEEPVATRLTHLLRQACEVNRWGLEELNIQADHVHLLLQVSPKDSVMNVMQTLNGGTARFLRTEFPGLVEYLWGESFWSDGYFAETVCQTQEAILRAYIRNQGLPSRFATANKQNKQSYRSFSADGNFSLIDLVR